jgi:hypothetical protein
MAGVSGWGGRGIGHLETEAIRIEQELNRIEERGKRIDRRRCIEYM